jgi:hypothetical protein
MWEPYGTWITPLAALARGHPASVARSLDDAASVASFAQYAQYVLLATAILWYGGRSTPGARSIGRDRRRASTAPSPTVSLDSGANLSI